MRKIFALAAAAAMLTVAACNTVAGVGEDAQAAGSAVEDCAEGTTCGSPEGIGSPGVFDAGAFACLDRRCVAL